jgi:hypothetical protein
MADGFLFSHFYLKKPSFQDCLSRILSRLFYDTKLYHNILLGKAESYIEFMLSSIYVVIWFVLKHE